VHTTPTASSLLAKAGGYSIAVIQTNASSTNEEITWTFTNNGCAPTNNVALDIPGWVWGGGSEDSYSLVDTGGGALVENRWTTTQTGSTVTFTALTVADRLGVGEDGEYRLTFSSTSNTTGSSITITITDANGYPSTISSTVTVNSYNFNSLNDASGLTWQEEFR
jgi:hypothetical protein